MINRNQLFPIAIGTFGLGAGRYESLSGSKDEDSNSSRDMKALIYSFKFGQNYIETSYIYAGGQTMNFLAKFFKKIPRNKIFITVKLEKYVERPKDIEFQLDKYLSLMGLDYADAFILHAPSVSKLPIEEVYYEMNKQIKKGKARFLSGSNLSLNQLKLLHESFKLFSIEGLYNLECKINEDVGIVKYCHENNIVFAAYQPLRRNRTAKRNYPVLVNLAKKYGKTQNQILINWIIKEKGLMPLIKASKIKHVKENLGSLKFDLEVSDIEKLNKFRNKEFDTLKVDWNDAGGIPIYKLANQLP